MKYIGNMSEEEIDRMFNPPKPKGTKKVTPAMNEPSLYQGASVVPDEEKEDSDLYEMPDDNELGPSTWHQHTKERTVFEQKVTRPGSGKLSKMVSVLSVDHPRDIHGRVKKSDVVSLADLEDDDPIRIAEEARLAKQGPQRDPDFDINEPGAILKPAPRQKDKNWKHEIAHILSWVIHGLILVVTLYFTYYIISLVKDPGVTTVSQMSTLMIILSIQVSLLSVNMIIGSVIRK